MSTHRKNQRAWTLDQACAALGVTADRFREMASKGSFTLLQDCFGREWVGERGVAEMEQDVLARALVYGDGSTLRVVTMGRLPSATKAVITNDRLVFLCGGRAGRTG